MATVNYQRKTGHFWEKRRMRLMTALLACGLCLALPSLSLAGEGKTPSSTIPKDDSGKYAYREVISVEGVPASELYARAKAWVARAYESAKVVIDLDDKDAGRLVIKGTFTVPQKVLLSSFEARISHVLTLEVKDGRYRYTLDTFIWTGKSEGTDFPLESKEVSRMGGYRGVLERVAQRADELIASLKMAMSKGGGEW